MKVIPIRLNDDVVAMIDMIATRQQRKRSALIKVWINAAIKQEVNLNGEGSINTNTVL